MQEIPRNNLAELFGALAKAQGQFKPIEKNREVTIRPRDKAAYSFRYADLQEILAKTMPALSANGLALIQTVEQAQAGSTLFCRLVHAAGGEISSSISLPSPRDLGDPKAFGAAITYLRRYLVTSMLGVAADDDLDEDSTPAGEGPNGENPAAETTKAGAQEPRAKPASEVKDRLVTVGEAKFLANKLAAAGKDLGDLMEGAPDNLADLTLSQFIAIKGQL